MSERLQASFGRRRGRKLRPLKQELFENRFSGAVISHASIQEDAWKSWASAYDEYVLEIGFGGGEHIAHLASQLPNTGFLGCEPFVNGVASLLAHIALEPCDNIRVYEGDVRVLLPLIPDVRFNRVYILFPDPWPKSRHAKRRLVQKSFLTQLKPHLAKGAVVRLATDFADYARHMLEVFLSDTDFTWTAQGPSDWQTRFSDSIKTRYETKLLGDTQPIFLEFKME